MAKKTSLEESSLPEEQTQATDTTATDSTEAVIVEQSATAETTVSETMQTPEQWGKAQGLKVWDVSGLMAYMRWLPGKVVTEAAFAEALEQFRTRPQGGGRVNRR